MCMFVVVNYKSQPFSKVIITCKFLRYLLKLYDFKISLCLAGKDKGNKKTESIKQLHHTF